jgi:hypothetical protein
MVPAETLRAYRAFLEYRLLMALDRRAIAYWADVTRVLTEALCDLGRHLGQAVSETPLRRGPGPGRGHVADPGSGGAARCPRSRVGALSSPGRSSARR